MSNKTPHLDICSQRHMYVLLAELSDMVKMLIHVVDPINHGVFLERSTLHFLPPKLNFYSAANGAAELYHYHPKLSSFSR